jgi:signal peptidase II
MIAMVVAFASVLALDQVSKAMISARLAEGAFSSSVLGARLRHVANRRRPWSSVTGVRFMALFLVVLAIAAWLTARTLHSTAADAAVGALVGGAAGNLLDGLNRRAVTDFIDLRVWPVFNIADAAIVAGAAWMFWFIAVTYAPG